jgi:hypothetical protein
VGIPKLVVSMQYRLNAPSTFELHQIHVSSVKVVLGSVETVHKNGTRKKKRERKTKKEEK